MRLFIVFLFTTFFLVGCKSTSTSTCTLPQAESTSSATKLVIYRPDKFYGVLYSTPFFYINGCRVSDVSNDSYHVYVLPAGEITVTAGEKWYADGGDEKVTGKFEAGNTYYIHYSMSAGEFYGGAGVYGFTTATHYAVVTKEFAYGVMPKLREEKI